MVVYDLICSNEHRFEGWFPSFEALKKQKAIGLLTCAICGDNNVDVVPSGGHIVKKAPAVKATTKGNKRNKEANDIDVVTLVKSLNYYIKNTFDNVGERFPDEARKIFYGDADKRNIFGTATPKEQKELSDEGVPFSLIPQLPDEFDN